MSDTNSIVLTGRLTHEPVLKIASDNPLVVFTLASNARAKVGEEWVDRPSFIDVKLWGRQAETLARVVAKGRRVTVTGSIQQERWSTDAGNRSKIVIKAHSWDFAGGRPVADEPPRIPVAVSA